MSVQKSEVWRDLTLSDCDCCIGVEEDIEDRPILVLGS